MSCFFHETGRFLYTEKWSSVASACCIAQAFSPHFDFFSFKTLSEQCVICEEQDKSQCD